MKAFRLKSALTVLVCLFTIFVNGCDAIWKASANEGRDHLPLRQIKVAVLNHPLTWSTDHTGFERDLLEKFAQEKGYRISWQVYKSEKDVSRAVLENRANLGAARFALNNADEQNLWTSPAYEEVSKSIICPIQKEENISFFKKIYSFKFGKKIPTDFEILNGQNKNAFELLRDINLERISCASIDSNQAKFFLRMFPRLEFVHESGPRTPIGFLIAKDQSELRNDLYSWFQTASRNHYIEFTRDLYFSHLNELNTYDSYSFFRTIKNDLQGLKPKFKKIAKEFHLPWTLVAAIAYQESHWDQDAKSYTGVRGLMMLTKDTAEQMGIEDRTDLMQSLWGGTKYFKNLLKDLPQIISPRQRLAIALASYNAGPAHLDRAQEIAVDYGRDPWSWVELKKLLPRLPRTTRANPSPNIGFSNEPRGDEPIKFVERVFNFYEILKYMDEYGR